MVRELHQLHGMFVYFASVNIINIFHSQLLIYVEYIAILGEGFVG